MHGVGNRCLIIHKNFSNISLTTNMEVLDRDLMNMIADFEDSIMRNTREEEAFDKAVRQWETDGVFDDIFGG